jgi:hypothetical protein
MLSNSTCASRLQGEHSSRWSALDDMYPFLSAEEIERIRLEAAEIAYKRLAPI